MENSRRKFMKFAGASAVGLAMGSAAAKTHSSPETEAAAEPAEDKVLSGIGHEAAAETICEHHVETNLPLPKPSDVKQWAMVIDTKKIEDKKLLESMIGACNKAHNIPTQKNKKHEIKWLWEGKYHNVFPTINNKHTSEEVEHRGFPVLCNHCENPPCTKACPTRATFKRADGIVMMDFHRCIGCRFCMAGCPYGARSFNYLDPKPAIEDKNYNPRFPTRTKGVVEKCNFCAERIAVGKLPACVEVSQGAIAFGDLGDPNSSVRKVLRKKFTVRRKPSLGTEPAVYYII